MNEEDRRPVEQAKINCAKKLFSQMSNSEICYHDVDSFDKMMEILGGEKKIFIMYTL